LYTFDALTKLGIFIIRTGRIKLFKTLDFAVDPTNKKIVYEAFQGPDLNDYKRKWYKQITLEIDEYGPGDMLGVDSFLTNNKLQFTAIT
jgi:CRP-like cAMP-binding protein